MMIKWMNAFIIGCLIVVILLLCFIFSPMGGKPLSADEERFQCLVMEVEGGYGYLITLASTGDTLIMQPYIPTYGGYIPFATKEKALAVGQLVCRKLSGGEGVTLSREEVDKLLE